MNIRTDFVPLSEEAKGRDQVRVIGVEGRTGPSTSNNV